MSRTADNTYRKKRAALKAKRLPCALCGRAIDYMAPPNHPDAFDADHVEALHAGGSNRGELQASHVRCNRSRGAREAAAARRALPPSEHVVVESALGRWL